MAGVALTPVDTFAATFKAVADGDPLSQATFVEILQKYADSLTYLKNRQFIGHLNVALGASAGMSVANDWTWSTTGRAWISQVAVASTLYFAVQVPPVQVSAAGNYPQITALNVTTKGSNHAGVLAASPMTVLLKKRSTTAVTTVGTATDTHTAGNIDTAQAWTAVPLTHAIVPGDSYFIEVANESGANAQQNSVIYEVSLTISPPSS